MTVSRFLLFSSKHRSSREALALLLPRCVPSNTIQSVRYTNSSKHDKPRHDLHPVFPSQSEGSRSWGAYTASAVALGFAGIAAFFHYNDERRAVPKGYPGDSHDRNVVGGPIVGGPFTLVNKEKQTVTEHDFLGNWILLYFGYTSSPDIGPEQVHLMAKAIDILESKQNLQILPVFVTIDPQRDTPSQLRAYLEEFNSRIVGLTGTVVAIRKMTQEYRVYFKKVEEDGADYLVDSSHNMYLLNPNMEVVRCFGVEYNAEQLTDAIGKELNKTPL
ncbi:protein SCO1 homolog 2, mitochondrial [Lathyrus oleraceus]|nr:protein SCO1 homolog 2, mitochondrial [Pisum sativum]